MPLPRTLQPGYLSAGLLGPFLTAARLKDHYSDHSLGTQFKGLWPWENLP